MKEELKRKHKDKKLTEKDLQYLVKDYFDDKLRNAPLTFTIERVDNSENKEELHIISVVDDNKVDLLTSDFLLSIQSLNDPDCYWLDSGVFDINVSL